MSSRFRIKSVFARSLDGNTVLCGVITQGSVKAGMKAKIEVHPQLFFVADIRSVEGILDTTATSNIGLVIDTPDEETRELWNRLPVPDEEIEIE